MEQKKQNNNQADKDFANDIGNMLADFINDTAGFPEEDEIYFRPPEQKTRTLNSIKLKGIVALFCDYPFFVCFILSIINE